MLRYTTPTPHNVFAAAVLVMAVILVTDAAVVIGVLIVTDVIADAKR